MARFHRSGTNWEGRDWVTTPSLNPLLDELEAAYPSKRKLDGTVASSGHDAANANSDHRPRPFTGDGIVAAVDVGELGPEGDRIAEAIRASRDPRIKYVIHERRMFASYTNSKGPAWHWRSYSGYNAHLSHVHVSVYMSNNSNPYNLDLGGGDGGLAAVQIIDLQKALNVANQKGADKKPLAEDDVWGENTAFALANGFRSLNDKHARTLARNAHKRLDLLREI